MVSLATANARTASGVTQYDITLKNTSAATIYAPLRIEIASITSASGRVTVANADNAKTGIRAAWDYSTRLGADNTLTANEISAGRTLKFNNPNGEAFTVTFNVIGSVDRSAAGGASSGGGSTGSGSGGSAPGGNTVNSVLYSMTYNALLNSITSQLIKP